MLSPLIRGIVERFDRWVIWHVPGMRPDRVEYVSTTDPGSPPPARVRYADLGDRYFELYDMEGRWVADLPDTKEQAA